MSVRKLLPWVAAAAGAGLGAYVAFGTPAANFYIGNEGKFLGLVSDGDTPQFWAARGLVIASTAVLAGTLAHSLSKGMVPSGLKV